MLHHAHTEQEVHRAATREDHAAEKHHPRPGFDAGAGDRRATEVIVGVYGHFRTHGSFLIRRQRGHPGVVLPLVISNSANH